MFALSSWPELYHCISCLQYINSMMFPPLHMRRRGRGNAGRAFLLCLAALDVPLDHDHGVLPPIVPDVSVASLDELTILRPERVFD